MQKFASYEDKPFIRNVENHTTPNNLNIEYNDFVVGFCGKLYGGRVKRFQPDMTKREFQYKKIYSTDQYNSFYQNINCDRETKRRLDVYFTPIVDDTIFLLYNCPMFIARSAFNGKNELNICVHTMNKPVTKKRDWIDPPNSFKVTTLDDMEFYNVFGAEQAYMEIESYMRGVLFKENKSVPTMSNEDKINLSGHSKDSFKG